jgi:hypothetical protein
MFFHASQCKSRLCNTIHIGQNPYGLHAKLPFGTMSVEPDNTLLYSQELV